MKQFFAFLWSLFNRPVDVPVFSGVATPTPQPSDWVRGKETGIVEGVRNITGDWRQYLSPGKWQRDIPGGTLFETEACMSFSAIDSIEAQLNFMLRYGLISDASVAWLKEKGYLDESGIANLSPRFTAKMSNTTEAGGNSYQNVWGSLRNDGVVPETAWPASFGLLTPGGQTPENWAQYYATPSTAAIALGKEWTQHFTIRYEWVDNRGTDIGNAAYLAALKMAPLHILTGVCMPWNTAGIIPGCNAGIAHATLLTRVDSLCRSIRDHYVPFDKRFANDYPIPWAVRGVLTEVLASVVPPHFSHTFATAYALGDTNVEIELIQNILKIEGCMPATVASSGFYGPITALAVGAFQTKFGVAPQSPNSIGPRTLALLNQAVINNRPA